MTGEKGCLTKTDRAYLRGEKEYDSKQALYARRKSIRDGARGALRDFKLLADELPAEERAKIFDAEPRSHELRELRDDVMKTITFLYAGVGGYPGFRHPLEFGVANGEVALGNAENALNVTPRFTVDGAYQTDIREATALIEVEEWGRLNPPDLFSFIRFAHDADGIDFDAVRKRLDFADWSSQFTGYKRRTIPGGKQTPLMDPEIYEREGIGTMSAEELHTLFGEGYSNSIRHVVYDGEKVIRYPGPWSDDDPEVIDWMGNKPTDGE